MPFAELNLTPSVNVETSAADNPSGVQESNFVRWRANLPEKRGGCTLYLSERVNGTPVSLRPWGDFQGESFLGIATPAEVYTYNATTAELRDISPKYAEVPLTSPSFTTSAGERYVTITDSLQPGVDQFSSVRFNTPVSVGGLILNGTYPVTSTAGVNTYVIDAGYAATADAIGVPGALPVFTTTGGLSRVLVSFPIQYQYNSLSSGNRIGFAVETMVGGLSIYGAYVVLQILGINSFSFREQYQANFSETKTMNGGFVSLTYWLATAPGPPPP